MAITTYRIDDDLLARLDHAAAKRGLPRTMLVREAIAEYLASRERAVTRSLVQLADDLAPLRGSGIGDLGSRSEEHLRARFAAKRVRTDKKARAGHRPR